MAQFADEVEYRAPGGPLATRSVTGRRPSGHAPATVRGVRGSWFEAPEFLDAGEDQVVVVSRSAGAARSAHQRNGHEGGLDDSRREDRALPRDHTRREALEAAGLSE